jgi:tetratricopeptide (TPR) repeat protein
VHGGLLRVIGRAQDSFPILLEGLALAEQHPSGGDHATYLLANLAENHYAAGDIPNAITYGERALEAARRLGNVMVEMGVLPAYGDALLAAGHPDRARQAWQHYLTLSADIAVADSTAQPPGRTAADTARDIHAKLAALSPDDHT